MLFLFVGNGEEGKAVKEVRLVLVVARSIWERLVGYQVIVFRKCSYF